MTSPNNEQPHLEWHEWQDDKNIVEKYGEGLIWYRYALYAFIVLNTYLCGCSLIALIPHILQGNLSFDDYQAQFNTSSQSSFAQNIFILTTGSYQSETITFVYLYVALFFFGIIAHPICYAYFVKKSRNHILELSTYSSSDPNGPCIRNEDDWKESTFHSMKRQFVQNVLHVVQQKADVDFRQHVISITPVKRSTTNIPDRQNKTVQKGKYKDVGANIIPNNIENVILRAQYAVWLKNGYNLLSICLFFILLGIYGLLLWVLQNYLYDYFNNRSEGHNISIEIWISVFLSFIQALVDLIWLVFCEVLRYVEIHNSIEASRKWQCMRLFLFRVFSLNLFYFVRVLILKDQQQCSVDLLGVQHVFIVVSYLAGDLIADFVVPICYRIYQRRRKHYVRDYDTWFEFDLSEQYSTVAFRHLMMCSGATFIPGISFVALLGNILQYKCDQYRLTYLCKMTFKVHSSYNKFSIVLGMITALTFLFGYPKGLLWLILNKNSFLSCDLLASSS